MKQKRLWLCTIASFFKYVGHVRHSKKSSGAVLPTLLYLAIVFAINYNIHGRYLSHELLVSRR